MSLLDLASEESHAFVTAICEELRAHKVQLATFRHSVDEIQDNLRAVKGSVLQGLGHGATARRLLSLPFQSHLNAVLADPLPRLRAEGIRVIDIGPGGSSFQFFTGEDESRFREKLGAYWNELARERDAASVAGIVRLRRGIRARMAQFGLASYVFIRRNSRVVEVARRFALTRRLYSENEVPPR